MEKENDIQEVEETSEDENLDIPETGEGEEDTTDWKETATTLQQKAIKQREKTKELKAKLKELEAKVPKETKETKTQPDEFKLSTGDKAYLKSFKDIQTEDEITLAKGWMEKYKLNVEDLISDEVFNVKLDKMREAKKLKDATPKNNNRSVGTNNSAVDYWIDKPFAEVPRELRADVLNAKLKRDEQQQQFG